MSELDHPKIRFMTRQIAAELRLERAFAELILDETRPQCFGFRCAPASRGWTCHVPDDVDVAYPLWSCNADQTLLVLRSGSVSYAEGHHDEPRTEHLADTSQGVLVSLFLDLYEDDVPEEELEAASEYCGFRHLRELIDFHSEHGRDVARWGERRRHFIASIDAAAARPRR